MSKIIDVSKVVKSFGTTTALKNLSFSVDKGEIFGFLGPSGAGKTTTIKLLTRQLKPDSGSMKVFLHPLDELKRDDDDRIGVLSDNSGVYERLTVKDNIELFAALRKVDKGIAMQTLEDVRLADQADKQAKQLSKGMKQRLMLAQAVLHKPQLLFLDEPTASLDPATSQVIHELIRKMNKNGTTIFLTTHNMEEADKLCGRVAFLNNGEIVELDEPEKLKIKYSKGFVLAKFESGKTVEEHATPKGLRHIAELAENDKLIRIHSQEPNLEDVFLAITGRALA